MKIINTDPEKYVLKSLFLVFAFWVFPLLAQEDDFSDYDSETRFSIAADASFNNDDFLVGIYPGVLFEMFETRASLFFIARPYEKKVYVRQSNNFQIRYLEWRSILGLNLEKHGFLYGNTGFSVGAGYGISFGTYAGSKKSAETEWLPVFKAGIDQHFGDVSVGIGYKYLKFPNVDNNNQFYISITY